MIKEITHCKSIFSDDKGKSYCGQVPNADYNPKPTCKICKQKIADVNKRLSSIKKSLRGIIKYPDRTVRL